MINRRFGNLILWLTTKFGIAIVWINDRLRVLWNTPIDRIISVLGLLGSISLSVILGCWSIKLSKEQIRLANVQISMSEEQGRTSLDLKHFQELLVKTDSLIERQSVMAELSVEQINRLVMLNNSLLKEVEMQTKQYNLNIEIFKENEALKIRGKIKDYKRVFDIVYQLELITAKFGIAKMFVKVFRDYKPKEYYTNLYSNAKSIMDLFNNRDELIFDSTLNAQWDLVYYFAAADAQMNDFAGNIVSGIKKSNTYSGTPDSVMKVNEFQAYSMADSYSVVLQAGLKEYSTKKIAELNRELKKLETK